MDLQVEKAWARAGTKALLTQANAEIAAMELAKTANGVERAALTAAARAASPGHSYWPVQKPTGAATGAAMFSRFRNLQSAELDCSLHELRCISMLPLLDALDTLDYTAGGYEGTPEVLYFNEAAAARKTELEDANAALFA